MEVPGAAGGEGRGGGLDKSHASGGVASVGDVDAHLGEDEGAEAVVLDVVGAAEGFDVEAPAGGAKALVVGHPAR